MLSNYVKSYKSYLKDRLPEHKSVWKVSLDGGFTCPNLDGTVGRGGCAYCDNASFSTVVGRAAEGLAAQYMPQMHALQRRRGAQAFLAYFQPFSNTYASVDKLRVLYEEALALPGVVGLCVGTRPDCIGPGVLDLLDELARKVYVCLELGLQSAHDRTLSRIGRGHDFACFARVMEACQGLRFDTAVHLIAGLPGEGRTEWAETAAALAPWNIHSVKIHPLHIVRGTRLERWWLSEHFALPSREDYVEGLADMLERLHPDMAVQRIHGEGLNDTLLAPDWAADRQGLERLLRATFVERGTRQGSAFLGTA